MTDERMHTLTVFWSENIWFEKYGATYPWSGKDAKLLQGKLGYLDSQMEKEQSEGRMKDVMRQYLNDTSAFYTNDRHPFSMMCSKFARWFVEEKKTTKKVDSVPQRGTYAGNELTEGEYIDRFAKDPIHHAKGFRWTGPILRKHRPDLYQMFKKILFDLIGEERCKKLWHEQVANETRAEKGLAPMTFTGSIPSVAPDPAYEVAKVFGVGTHAL